MSTPHRKYQIVQPTPQPPRTARFLSPATPWRSFRPALAPCVLLLLLLLPLSAHTQQADRKLNAEARNLSARLLLGELNREFSTRPVDADLLYRTMREQPRRCTRREDALQLTRTAWQNALREQYRRRAAELLKDLHLDSTAELPDAVARRNLAERFPAAFDQARKQLCREEQERLREEIYPSEQEVEAHSDPELLKLLTERFNARREIPLLEENLPFLQRERLTPVIRDARRQAARQLELVAALVPPPGAEAPQLAALYREQLNRELKKLQPAPGCTKVYGWFPATERALQARVAAFPQEQLERELREANLAIPSPADFRNQLERNPAASRTPEQGRQQAESAWCAQALTDVLKTSRSKLNRAAAEAHPPVGKILRERFHNEVEPNYRQGRQQAVAEEWSDRFPTLADGSWLPDAEAVENAYLRDQIPKPETWFPILPEVFSENAEAARKAVADAFREGSAALALQLETVNQLYDRLLRELRAQQAAGDSFGARLAAWFGFEESELSPEQVEELYTRRVLQTYRETPAAARRPELFPAAEREIQIKTRALLMELAKPRPAVTESRSEPDAPDEPPPLRLEWTLDSDGQSITLYDPEFRVSGSAAPEAYAATERKILDAAATEIRRRRAAAPDAQVELLLRVRNGAIRYQLVALLRRTLQDLCPGARTTDELGEPPSKP